MGGAARRNARKPPTGSACAVSRHGTSFPPLRLGSGTPNLSSRRRRRRAPSGADPSQGAPAHVPTHAPAYGGGQGSRAGGGPARGGARRVDASSLPPLFPSPLPPPFPKNVPLRGELLRPEVAPPSFARPFSFLSPHASVLCSCGGRGRTGETRGTKRVRWAWGGGFNPRAGSWLQGAGRPISWPPGRVGLGSVVGRAR